MNVWVGCCDDSASNDCSIDVVFLVGEDCGLWKMMGRPTVFTSVDLDTRVVCLCGVAVSLCRGEIPETEKSQRRISEIQTAMCDDMHTTSTQM